MPRSNSSLPPAVGIGGNSCRQCPFSMSVSGIGGSASSTVTLTGARRAGRSCRPTRGARRARQRRKAGVWSRPTAAARVMPCLRVLLPIPALAPKLDAQAFRFCQARPQRGAQKSDRALSFFGSSGCGPSFCSPPIGEHEPRIMIKMSSALTGRGAMAVVKLEIKTRQLLADGRKLAACAGTVHYSHEERIAGLSDSRPCRLQESMRSPRRGSAGDGHHAHRP